MRTTSLLLAAIFVLGVAMFSPSLSCAASDGIYTLAETAAAWDCTDANRLKAATADYTCAYGDESSVTYSLPWAFTFYGQAYSQVTADTNGNIWFTASGSAHSFNLANTGRGPVISAWNNDLSSYFNGGVFIQHKTNLERVVIQWRTETYTDEGEYRLNDVEAVLFPNGNIRLDYGAYHADGLGSITAITDASKNVVQSYTYDSFGMVTPANNTFRNSYTYTGREWDKEAGLYYYRARYYDPMEGRFISKDPISFAGGDVNLYGYVQNNPINRIDPSGLDWIYSQSTGQLFYQPPASAGGGPPQPIATGYSGNGAGLNNPAMQDAPSVGPIPEGTWTIGPQRNNRTGSGHNLPASMRLTPQDIDTDRSGFLIHGDNGRGNQSASEGCVIQNRNVRNRIGNSGDNILRVFP